MKRVSSGPILTTVFVDYDNIYLSLKRKSEEAAKRFARESNHWITGILSGDLITPTSPYAVTGERRVVMNRCYGNPVPRRNAHDNSTDMNSFPFVRHHFLRSGFEVIDCPPLTQQLKNSADIRIVMDIRDILNHDTHFDEFIILSGDADFTPVLHRLRAHARHTVVFANDHTAQPYTAISDGEIRESSLIAMLLNGRSISADPAPREIAGPGPQQIVDIDAARRAIVSEVVGIIRTSPQPVPLETLADRAVRMVGRERTVGTNWGGFGTFRDLLLSDLPDDIHLSDTPPYMAFDANRHISSTGLIAPQTPQAPPQPAIEQRRPEPAPRFAPEPPQAFAPQTQEKFVAPAQPLQPQSAPQQPMAQAPSQRSFQPAPAPRPSFDMRVPPPAADTRPAARQPDMTAYAPAPPQTEPARPPQQAPYQPEPRREAPRGQMPVSSAPTAPRSAEQATQIQQSIARIHEACQAPALAPAEYRVLFDVMAQEISANGLQGSQTLANITQKTREFGLDLKRDDLRFILEVVSESDPWFEQGASANLFASRFRNFVVARCRSQGLSLSADELDLIEAWFAAPQPQQARAPNYGRTAPPASGQPPAAPNNPPSDRWWGSLEEGRQHMAEQRGQNYPGDAQDDEFPRIVRSRLRG